MSPKLKNIKIHLLYTLMQLLLDCLDDLKATSPRMLQLKNNMIEMCELLSKETADTFIVQKTTYFSELSNKINTLIRKTYNTNV